MTDNVGYLGHHFLIPIVGHTMNSVGSGVVAGLDFYVFASPVSVVLAMTPDVPAPRFWSVNTWVQYYWYLAFYASDQLPQDLMQIVGQGKNWELPPVRPPLLRYLSAPVLAIVYNFAFPEIHSLNYDPMMITGFILSTMILLSMLLGLILLQCYDTLVPDERRNDVPVVTMYEARVGETVGPMGTPSSNVDIHSKMAKRCCYEDVRGSGRRYFAMQRALGCKARGEELEAWAYGAL